MNFIRKVAGKIATLALPEKLYWRFRNHFDPNWAENYITHESLAHPHRSSLIEVIAEYAPFNRVLEVGCASGPNLFLLSPKFPNADLTGFDVSKSAVSVGNAFFRRENVRNVTLLVGELTSLIKMETAQFDVVFTDAVLIYVHKKDIKKIASQLFRVARKAIVLCEWHTDDAASIKDGHWVHNYKKIFSNFIEDKNIKLTKFRNDQWSGEWAKYGYIIEVWKQE